MTEIMSQETRTVSTNAITRHLALLRTHNTVFNNNERGWRMRGCPDVSCSIHSNGSNIAEKQIEHIGLPLALASLEQAFFENLDWGIASIWESRFMGTFQFQSSKSAAVLWIHYAHWLLTDPEIGAIKYVKNNDQRNLIEQVTKLIEQNVIDPETWNHASQALFDAFQNYYGDKEEEDNGHDPDYQALYATYQIASAIIDNPKYTIGPGEAVRSLAQAAGPGTWTSVTPGTNTWEPDAAFLNATKYMAAKLLDLLETSFDSVLEPGKGPFTQPVAGRPFYSESRHSNTAETSINNSQLLVTKPGHGTGSSFPGQQVKPKNQAYFHKAKRKVTTIRSNL